MLSTLRKGLLSGTFNSTHRFFPESGHGLSRSFSSCQIRAARRTPTEEELLTMSPSLRWYYRKMEDPVFRRQSSDRTTPRTNDRFSQMKRQGTYELYRKSRQAYFLDRWHNQPNIRFGHNMSKWLLRLSVDPRKAFDWKTHLPVVYLERVRKTCSICLSSYKIGARVW